MQALAGAFLLLAGAYQAVISIVAWPVIKEAAQRAILGQRLAPGQEQQIVTMGAFVGVGVGVGIGVVLLLLGILSLARRSPWVFYADLVVFGFSAIGVVTGVAGLRAGEGPAAFFQLVAGALAAALFIWMLSVSIDIGPWACRKVPLRP
jgi:hypothetical protein